MKKVILSILVLTYLLIFSSCGGDDDPTPSIIGTWKLTNFVVNGESYFDDNVCLDQMTQYFYQDATWKIIYYENDPSGNGCIESSETENGIYEINGNSIVFSGPYIIELHYTFTLSDTQLEMTTVYLGNSFVETYQRVN